VDRRLALISVWALFAAASVGVGFGAAGLVGDPFTDSGAGVVTAAGSPTQSSGTPTPSESSGSPSPSSSPAETEGSSAPGGTPEGVTRSITTRGGLVYGTCRNGLVRLSAAPAVGWEIDDLDEEADTEPQARFERVDDGDGRVEVSAVCAAGVPRFSVEDDSSGSGSGGSDDSGGSDESD